MLVARLLAAVARTQAFFSSSRATKRSLELASGSSKASKGT